MIYGICAVVIGFVVTWSLMSIFYKGETMSIENKLSVILNRVFPKESNIKLIVQMPTDKGYEVQIVKNNKGLEHFYINQFAAIRLVAEGDKCEK